MDQQGKYLTLQEVGIVRVRGHGRGVFVYEACGVRLKDVQLCSFGVEA